MQLNEQISLWNKAMITVTDVRHTVLERGQALRAYRLPSSAFLYIRGTARVWLDRKLHPTNRFHLLHGGKGVIVHMEAEEELEYYIILYKAEAALPGRPDAIRFDDGHSPFHLQYAFAPHYPLTLFERLAHMYEQWHAPAESAELGKLQVKATFYQFVYELLWQLHKQEIEPVKPDRVAQAVRYIHEHYREPLTLDMIAVALECSEGHLSRLFKSRLDVSPMHYLARVRTDRAIQLLARTDATLQEIAEQVGFTDAHSLSRSFKKHTGLSPQRFKNQKLPALRREIAVQQSEDALYNDIENHFHYQKGSEAFMHKKTKLAAMALAMSLSLLAAGCSGAANTNGNAPAQLAAGAGAEQPADNRQSATGAASEQQADAQAATRTVSTPRGDVEVPAEPQRVAADQYMGYLLKLGIIPVGVRTLMLDEGWFAAAGITQDMLAGIEDLGGGFPMNLEKLAMLEPDLIIASVDTEVEQFEKIAPTVFMPYWDGESTSGPLDKFRKLSEVFGKQQEAEAWIAEYEGKVAEARKALEGVIKEGETVSVLQIADKAAYVFGATGGNYGSSTIYEMLQLPPTESALAMEEGFKSISLEALPEYLGDHVFVYNGTPEPLKQVMDSEMWKAIPAVKNNQVYLYGNNYYDEFLMEDPYSLELQLETIVGLLLAGKQ